MILQKQRLTVPDTARCGVRHRQREADLERNIVVSAPASCSAGEVRGVGRHVAARGEAAVATAAPVARTEELDRFGDDLDLLPFAAAVFGLPLAPVETALDRNRAALGEV